MARNPGIEVRHARNCGSRQGSRCNCSASYRASVYSPRDDKKIRRTFKNAAEARSWRAEAKRAIDQGALRASGKTTVREAAADWLAGARRGEVRNRSGAAYKPSALRGYEQALRLRVLPEIGGAKLTAITTADLQLLVDRWQADGLPASTIRNTVKPLQAMYRRACTRQGLPVNPTRDLELPAPRPKEVEIVGPDVAAALLAAAPAYDRPIWATALYAGLRYAELRALAWESVNLATGKIRVTRSWDDREGIIDPKTRTSVRTVPMPQLLRELLLDLRLGAKGASEGDLVFGRGGSMPFAANVIYRRADKAWALAGVRERLRLHQARHTYASFMIAAGVNPKALASYMGHSSIKVTFDLYGHLLPGSEAEAAALLDKFLIEDRSASAVVPLFDCLPDARG